MAYNAYAPRQVTADYTSKCQRLFILVHASCQQNNMRAMADGQTTLTMRRNAEVEFRAHYQQTAAQYSCFTVLCGA